MSQKTRKRRSGKPEVIFTPVHAASMSLPIWAGMVRDFGEPDLNPQEPLDWSEPQPWLDELIDRHRPQESKTIRKLAAVPAWAQDTSTFLLDRAAYLSWRARMKQDETDKEPVQDGRDADDHETQGA